MNDDETFQQTARQALNEADSHLDGATRSRLRQARAVAVERASRPRSRLHFVPAFAYATIAALAIGVAFTYLPERNNDAGETMTALTDLDLVLSEEGLELDEDLEFFQWLEPNHAG